MSNRVEVGSATVAQSAMVSGDIAITGALDIAIIAPELTSCQAFLQGNFDTTSAGFVRIAELDGGGDFTWTTGPGSNALTAEVLKPFAFFRIELDIDQDAAREFRIVRKF